MAGCREGRIIQVRDDVGADAAKELERIAAKEPNWTTSDGAFRHVDAYVRVLEAEAPVESADPGLLWVFPDRIDYQHEARLIGHGSEEGQELMARFQAEGVPQSLVDIGYVDVREFWAPWCLALAGEEIVSVAITPGIAEHSAEVGIATLPAFRGRGFAAAAVAGWAALPSLRGRTLFYGTTRDNVSSQRVAARLGLRFIGSNLSII